MSLLNFPQVNPSNISDIARDVLTKPAIDNRVYELKKIVHINKDNLTDNDSKQQELKLDIAKRAIRHISNPTR